MRSFRVPSLAFAVAICASCKPHETTETVRTSVASSEQATPAAATAQTPAADSAEDATVENDGAFLTQPDLGVLDLFRNPTSCPPSTPNCGVQPGGSDSRGYWGDSDFNVYMYDGAGKALPGREGTIKIYDWSNTRVVWQTSFTSDANGFYRSQKIWGARGLPVKVCSAGYLFGYSNGQFLVYDFLGANACYSGRVNSSGLLTIAKLVIPNPKPVALNIIELIQTGTYCPPQAQIITQDSLSIPLLGVLGICRKLDTQVIGKVLDETGAPAVAAEVDLAFDTSAANPVHEIVYSGIDGKFTSSRVSRVRGKPISACVKLKDYARLCQTTVASTSDTKTYFDDSVAGSKSLHLIANKEPIGSFTFSAAPNAEGNYPEGVVLTGWAFDPDYNDAPVTVALQINGVIKKVIANLPSDGPCTTYSVCDRPNSGFKVDLSGLPLNLQYTSVLVAMLNKPQPKQEITDLQYQPFPANNPFTVQSRLVSIWPEATVPTIDDSTDTKAYELGVKFTSDVAGYVTGLKFYKSGANTGAHTGTLWSAAGKALATATFTNETASGWQHVTFATPVAVVKGTTYVASYHMTVGHYAADKAFFAAPVDRAPLHVPATGGVNLAGASGFPKNATQMNYWVDIVFDPPPPDVTPPTVTSVNPNKDATNVMPTVAPSVMFSEELNASTVSAANISLSGASGTIATKLTYSAASNTATLTPAQKLAPSTSFTVLVKGGSSGVKDLAGNALAADFTSSFTTGIGVLAPPVRMWPTTKVPSVTDAGDVNQIELGVNFTADVNGYVSGVSFYKSAKNTGSHTGSLWSSTGTLLATAVFASETASGWQTVKFATPVYITAGTKYVASYHAMAGHYAFTHPFFKTAFTSNGLHVPVNGGVYLYGAGGFPKLFTDSGNYWVDVLFSKY